jgi:spore coat polysaccharide biosynthesis protein SpsF
VANLKLKVVIIVQARTGSTRLPGKILKKVEGRPLLSYQIERLRKVENANELVIATTTKSNDDEIVSLCDSMKCSYFRGSEHNVLSRYYNAAIKFKADCIVRINSDCPLIDYSVVEEIIEYYINNFPNYDYVSNILEKSYPIGMHTEIFSFDALNIANKKSFDKDEREHVTPYIYRNKDIFKLKSIKMFKDLSDYRLTVDYPEDFEVIKKIISDIYPKKKYFNMHDIVSYLDDNIELKDINSNIEKKQTI